MTDALDTLLLEKSDLTADDLQQARDFAVQTGIGLGRAILKRKTAEEQELLEILAEYFQLSLSKTLPQGTDIEFTTGCPSAF